MKNRIILIITIFLVIGCAVTTKFRPVEEELAVMQEKVPGITYEEIMKGYSIYLNTCSACHRLHSPKEYTKSGWEKVLPEMFGKAKMTDPEEQELLKGYLLSKSK